MIRTPVASGLFYESSGKKLLLQIENCINLSKKPKSKIAVKGAVSPHAGYIYSGKVAASVFNAIEFPDSFIILCPNHTGLGKSCAVYSKGSWETPLGNVDIDGDIAGSLIENSEFLEEDYLAHIKEHSIEVQLPFIQYFRKDAKIVPVCLGTQKMEVLKSIGDTIAEVIQDQGKKVAVISSSDMTHYEPEKTAKEKDKKAIDAIIKLDEKLLEDYVKRYSISMCGFAPTISLITASKKQYAKKADLVEYTTSAEASGDSSSVVGYSGIIIS